MVVSFIIAVAVGTLFGFFAGLGTGGGSLLILWLTNVVGLEQAIARSVNLLFYIPSALLASIFFLKRGRFPVKKILPAIIAGCLAAAILSFASQSLEINVLQKAFGILLIFIGLRELFYKQKQ